MVRLRIRKKEREVKREESATARTYTIDEEIRHRILSLRAQYKILETYPVNDPWARIHILEHRDTGELEYYVDEIPLSSEEKSIYKRVESLLFWELEPAPPDIDPREHFKEQATKILSRFRIRFGASIHPGISWRKIEYYLLRDTIGYGAIDPLMRDLNVEDISCDGVGKHVYVWHQRYESLKTNIVFKRESELDSLVLKLAHRAGKHVSVAFPIVDAILPEGHRLAATYKKEVSTSGSTFTIRKFKETPLSIIDLIRGRTLSPRLGAYFWMAMEHNMTGMIMGVTGSGKSVSGNSWMLVRIDGELVYTSIEDLWNRLSRLTKPVRGMGFEIIVNPDIQVRSFDLKRKRVVWRRPLYFIRHLNDKRLYRVITRSNRFVDVTEDHSLIIYDKEARRFYKTTPGDHIKGKSIIYLTPISSNSILHGDTYSIRENSQSIMLITTFEPNTSPYTIDDIVDVYRIECSDCRYVYDFEVPGTHNFEANGIIVHNTTTLNALATLLRPTIKVVTIEDTPELKLTLENWVQLVARPSYGFVRGVSEITLYDLVKVSLRYRPDVLIVGEVRGEEAKVLFQAIASVSWDTPILVKDESGNVESVNIGELVDKFYLPGEERIAKEVEGLYTLSHDGYRVKWKPIKYVLRHRADRIYRIQASDGVVVKATGEHSVYVLDEDTLDVKVKRVDELKPGDLLLTPGKIDLLNLTKHEREISVAFPSKTIQGQLVEVLNAHYNNNYMKGMKSCKLVPVKPFYKLLEMIRIEQGIVDEYTGRLKGKRFIDEEAALELLYDVISGSSNLSANALKFAVKILSFINGNLYPLQVVEVTPEEYDGYVYDVSVPGTESFFGGYIPVLLHNTGHGGISTIHAEDIDSMVKRLMSPPMDIPSGYIPLIDFALAIRRVKIANPDGTYRIARVITDVWEIHDVNEYFTVAKWDPVTRKHEVDLEGSMVLGKISKLTGRSISDLIEDISRRELILRWMAIEGLSDYREVGRVIGEYYRRPNVVTKRAITKIKELERFD